MSRDPVTGESRVRARRKRVRQRRPRLRAWTVVVHRVTAAIARQR